MESAFNVSFTRMAIRGIIVLLLLSVNTCNTLLQSHSSLTQTSKQTELNIYFPTDLSFFFLYASISASLLHSAQGQEKEQERIAFNYTYSHPLSGIHYIISYESNTNELTVTSGEKGPSNLHIITPYIAAKNLDYFFDKNGFFKAYGNGPPFIPNSAIETLTAMNDTTTHTVEWGNSPNKEIPSNLLIFADLVKDALCLSYADDIIIPSTKDSNLNYVLC